MVTLSRLKLVRQRKALTQQELAEKAGVNRVTIARLEAGTDQPLPATVRKLAGALSVEPEDLMEPGRQLDPQVQQSDDLTDLRLPGIEDPGVRRLLERTPDLAALVNEAIDEIRRVIPDARLTLELIADPDEGSGRGEQIFLGIFTNLEDDAAVAALDIFDTEWWVHHMGRSGGLLCIDLRYG